MSNEPKRENEQEDFRRAITQQGLTPGGAQGESNWDKATAGLREAADRSTGWVGARIKDIGADFVGRFLLGETITPEPSDKYDQQAPEPEKGRDR